MNGCLISFATYQAMLRMREQMADAEERAAADERLRRYRRENLFWRLGGLPVEVAEAIAGAVYGDPSDWDRWYHFHPQPLVGFKA